MPALSRYALARPNARSSHRIPTPQGAGVAVIAATLVVASVTLGWSGAADTTIPLLVFAAAVTIAVVGFIDDIHPIAVAPRLILQAVAVGAVLFAAPEQLRIVPTCPLWLERAVLLLGGLWFVNLVNFMDGLDWMTVAEVVPITAMLALFGLIGELTTSAAVVAAALGGAMLGFAPFNRPVAKVFLGDVGSLPIGLLLGWCLLDLAYRQHVAAAMLLPLYYLADASLTLMRRLAKREAVWLPHRTHFYQRATDNGLSTIQVAAWVFGTNCVLGILAWLSITWQSLLGSLVLLSLGAAAVTLTLVTFSTPRQRRNVN